MDFDFTLRELVKIILAVAALVLIGFIIYFFVEVAPHALQEFFDKPATAGSAQPQAGGTSTTSVSAA